MHAFFFIFALFFSFKISFADPAEFSMALVAATQLAANDGLRRQLALEVWPMHIPSKRGETKREREKVILSPYFF
jgi:hypothetical protein